MYFAASSLPIALPENPSTSPLAEIMGKMIRLRKKS